MQVYQYQAAKLYIAKLKSFTSEAAVATSSHRLSPSRRSLVAVRSFEFRKGNGETACRKREGRF
jgi:hypothetical protein